MARCTLFIYIYKSSKSFKNGFNVHWSLQIFVVHARLNRTSKLLASPLVTISSWENDPTWSNMFKKRSSFLVKTIGIDAGGFRLGVSGQLGCTWTIQGWPNGHKLPKQIAKSVTRGGALALGETTVLCPVMCWAEQATRTWTALAGSVASLLMNACFPNANHIRSSFLINSRLNEWCHGVTQCLVPLDHTNWSKLI